MVLTRTLQIDVAVLAAAQAQPRLRKTVTLPLRIYFIFSTLRWAEAVLTLTFGGDAPFQRVVSSVPEWLLGAVKRSWKYVNK